jgi:hypothetical protein
MALDLSDVALDPDLGTAVSILRTSGYYGPGGWQTNPTVSIPCWGVWNIANDKALQMVPEGDRVVGAVQFITTTRMFPTTEAGQQTSDQVNWNGNLYRVQSVGPWSLDGFFNVILVRMTGS